MDTRSQELARRTARTIAEHIGRMGWEEGDRSYSVGMVFADLIAWSRCNGVDFEAEFASARAVVEEVYDEEDFGDIGELPTLDHEGRAA